MIYTRMCQHVSRAYKSISCRKFTLFDNKSVNRKVRLECGDNNFSVLFHPWASFTTERISTFNYTKKDI